MTEITRTPNDRGLAVLASLEEQTGAKLFLSGEPGIPKPSVNLPWKVTKTERGWTAVTQKFVDAKGNGLRLVVNEARYNQSTAFAFGAKGMVEPPGFCNGDTPDAALEILRQKLTALGYGVRKQ